MVRGILRMAGTVGFFAGAAALVVMGVTWKSPRYLSHAAAGNLPGVYVWSGHGRVSVVVRNGPEKPGMNGWRGVDKNQTGVNVGVHGERYVAAPWWAVAGGLLAPWALSMLLMWRDRVVWYRFCPACGETIGEAFRECARCGTRLEDGAIACGATADVPDGVDTAPACNDSASFADGRVVIRGDVARLRVTMAMLAFAGIMLMCGGISLFVAYKIAQLPEHWLSFETIFAAGAIIPLLAGLLFVVVALLMVIFHKRMKLDRVNGTMWWASGWPGKTYSIERGRAGVQILGKGGSGSKAYKCYEVNVIAGSERVNVLSHGNAKLARYDARRLADFLGVQLMDHTGEIISRADNERGYRLVEKAIHRQKTVTLASS